MMRRSGQVFRYQTGNQWEMSSDFPCRGGIDTRRRRMRPVARSVRCLFSRRRCGAGVQEPWERVQARPAGVASNPLE